MESSLKSPISIECRDMVMRPVFQANDIVVLMMLIDIWMLWGSLSSLLLSALSLSSSPVSSDETGPVQLQFTFLEITCDSNLSPRLTDKNVNVTDCAA